MSDDYGYPSNYLAFLSALAFLYWFALIGVIPSCSPEKNQSPSRGLNQGGYDPAPSPLSPLNPLSPIFGK